MGSAFKNFIITFSICLLVFGFLGFTYVPDLLENMKMEKKEESSNVSSEVQTESSAEDDASNTDEPVTDSSNPALPDSSNTNIINPDGKVFTAVIMTVDEENYPVDIVFIDSNAKTERFIYCPIPVDTKVKNNLGMPIEVKDLFCTISNEEVAECVSFMTGIETQFCFRFTRDSLKKIVNTHLNYSIKLEKDEVSAKGVPIVTDGGDIHYISNVDGGVKLRGDFYGKDNIEWLLDYAPENVELNDYNLLYSKIAKAMLRQFLGGKIDGSTSNNLQTIINSCDTNFTTSDAANYMDNIFAYGEFAMVEFDEEKRPFPTYRENAITELREADGSYN